MKTRELLAPYQPNMEEIPAFPTIPYNFGVRNRPIIIVNIVAGTLAILIIGLGLLSTLLWGNMILTLFLTTILLIIIVFWFMLSRIHQQNVEKKYRSFYIRKVLQPWFNVHFNLDLYENQVNLFLSGTPVFLNQNIYIHPRLNPATGEVYMSFSTINELSNANYDPHTTHPRVKLNPTKKKPRIENIPENYGYVILNVDNNKYAVYKQS